MGTREAVVVQQVQQLVKLVKAICRLVDGALTVALLRLDGKYTELVSGVLR